MGRQVDVPAAALLLWAPSPAIVADRAVCNLICFPTYQRHPHASQCKPHI